MDRELGPLFNLMSSSLVFFWVGNERARRSNAEKAERSSLDKLFREIGFE